jgi:hypothetical protein
MQNSGNLARLMMLTSMLITIDAINAAQVRAQQALSSATNLKCVFSVYATGAWRENTPEAEVKAAKLVLEFSTAKLIGSWIVIHPSADAPSPTAR